ncbi:protein HEXIM1 [Bombina bombina]|uniref:protein HEXIM1 n=1 Tax=Bombina bombina TaxID=8345 RepID=UPI00235AD22E|nr:protein HEXIM1 [Bombina bombina]
MAEVKLQDANMPCKSLEDGISTLNSSEDSGWQQKQKNESPGMDCTSFYDTEERHHSELEKPDIGQVNRANNQQDEEWKELGKKKHRRRPSKKKRRWKPYNKLTWEEKKMLEEKESRRASMLRAEMFAKGQPVAPYNTTQFLMEDHDQEEPDLCPPQRKAISTLMPPNANTSTKGDSSEEDLEEEEDETGSDGMGGHDGAEFLQKDFSETYERYHAESLQDMSKQELIREYMELEKCLSRMEEENNQLRLQVVGNPDSRIRELETEVEKLKEENRLLREKAQCEPVVGNQSSH